MANQEFNSVPRSFAIVINTDVALETLVRLGKIVVKLLTSHSHGSQPRASGQFFSAAADGDDDDSDHKVPVREIVGTRSASRRAGQIAALATVRSLLNEVVKLGFQDLSSLKKASH
jgi:hypothetical protein